MKTFEVDVRGWGLVLAFTSPKPSRDQFRTYFSLTVEPMHGPLFIDGNFHNIGYKVELLNVEEPETRTGHKLLKSFFCSGLTLLETITNELVKTEAIGKGTPVKLEFDNGIRPLIDFHPGLSKLKWSDDK